jgi:hypothetical protein
MTKYLISFPSAAMVVPQAEFQAVADAARAVIAQAQAAVVYVFGGGINKGVSPREGVGGRLGGRRPLPADAVDGGRLHDP